MNTNTNITCDDPEINVAHNNKYKDKKHNTESQILEDNDKYKIA